MRASLFVLFYLSKVNRKQLILCIVDTSGNGRGLFNTKLIALCRKMNKVLQGRQIRNARECAETRIAM